MFGCCCFRLLARVRNVSFRLVLIYRPHYIFQEEYRREQLEWTFIHFPDNGDCITLIEKKPNGIIPTLDEQCIIGRATDDRFARELYKKSESNSRYDLLL